jgi:hypothetical protein
MRAFRATLDREEAQAVGAFLRSLALRGAVTPPVPPDDFKVGFRRFKEQVEALSRQIRTLSKPAAWP